MPETDSLTRLERLLFAACVALAVYSSIHTGLALSESMSDHAFVATAAGTGSMEPTFDDGDHLLVENVTAPDEGDIIAFRPNGDESRPVTLHRAQFHVKEGENWYKQANPDYVDHESCDASPACPARNSGWITLGESNEKYDQERGLTRPVKESWVEGRVEFIVED